MPRGDTVFSTASDALRAELDPPRADAIQDALDEHILGDDVLALSSVQRSSGRTIAARPAVRSSRSSRERVAEQVGNPALESVESRERVLTQGEEHVHAQRPVHQLGERTLETPFVAVVGEVLLRLVEDHVDVTRLLHPLGDGEQVAIVGLSRPASAAARPCSG